jgi:hypothetical protein
MSQLRPAGLDALALCAVLPWCALAACSGEEPRRDAGGSAQAQDAESASEDDADTPSEEGSDAGASGPVRDSGPAPSGNEAGVLDATSPGDGAAEASAAEAGGAPSGPGVWKQGRTMPTVRTELAVAELGGKIYVAGGYGGPGAFEAYDPANDTWQARKNLPMGHDHPSPAALDGRIYVTGGNASETYAYDPANDSWTQRASLIHARYAAALVALDGALYLIGGTGPSAPVVQRYDPTANTWTARAPLSMTRDHVAAVALEGKIYALGGRPGVGDVYESVEIYDPAADRFTPGVAMQEGRSGFAAAVVAGRIYVAGGEVLEQPFSVRDTAEEFDPARGSWRFIAKLPGPLHGIGAVGYLDRVFVFGGAANPASATPRTGAVNVLTPN